MASASTCAHHRAAVSSPRSPIDPASKATGNASGIAAILEVAASLHESGVKPARSILFLAVTGEEKGELGSRYFAAHPTVPRARIVANVNTDMFLPLFPLKTLMVLGLDESDLGNDIRATAKAVGVNRKDLLSRTSLASAPNHHNRQQQQQQSQGSHSGYQFNEAYRMVGDYKDSGIKVHRPTIADSQAIWEQNEKDPLLPNKAKAGLHDPR